MHVVERTICVGKSVPERTPVLSRNGMFVFVPFVGVLDEDLRTCHSSQAASCYFAVDESYAVLVSQDSIARLNLSSMKITATKDVSEVSDVDYFHLDHSGSLLFQSDYDCRILRMTPDFAATDVLCELDDMEYISDRRRIRSRPWFETCHQPTAFSDYPNGVRDVRDGQLLFRVPRATLLLPSAKRAVSNTRRDPDAPSSDDRCAKDDDHIREHFLTSQHPPFVEQFSLIDLDGDVLAVDEFPCGTVTTWRSSPLEEVVVAEAMDVSETPSRFATIAYRTGNGTALYHSCDFAQSYPMSNAVFVNSVHGHRQSIIALPEFDVVYAWHVSQYFPRVQISENESTIVMCRVLDDSIVLRLIRLDGSYEEIGTRADTPVD